MLVCGTGCMMCWCVRGVLEIIGPRGISNVIIKLTQNISNLQSGMVFNYALIMIVFTTLFISGAPSFSSIW